MTASMTALHDRLLGLLHDRLLGYALVRAVRHEQLLSLHPSWEPGYPGTALVSSVRT